MTEPTFLTDEGFATLKTIRNIRKLLQREGQMYKRELHTRCGYDFSTQEFNNILAVLVKENWCSVQEGALRAPIVVLNPEYNKTHGLQPDEVIADACKPVAQ